MGIKNYIGELQINGSPVVTEDKLNFSPVATSGSFNDLLDKPFYEIALDLALDMTGYSIAVNENDTLYLQTESVYQATDLIGAIVTGKYTGNPWTDILIPDMIIDETANGCTFYLNYASIVVAYNANYIPPMLSSPIGKTGIYFIHNKQTDYFITGLKHTAIRYLDNKYLDLPNNEDYKAIVEELQNKKAIIDVEELPDSDIKTDVFYRTPGKAYVVYNGRKFLEGTPSYVILLKDDPRERDNFEPLEHFNGTTRIWYYWPEAESPVCYYNGVWDTPAERWYGSGYGGIVTKNSDGSFTFPAQENPAVDRVVNSAFYLVYEPNNYMLYYMNTDTGRWTYVPTVEDSLPFNAGKYERINLMQRNGDGNMLATASAGVSSGSIPMRTAGGALRGDTSFTGLASEAEKQQVLVNMKHLENKVIEVERISNYNYHYKTWAPINRTLPVLRENQLYIISGVSVDNTAETQPHQLIVDPSVSQPTIYQMRFYGYGFYVDTGYHLMLYKNNEFHEIHMSIPTLTSNSSLEISSLVPPTYSTSGMTNPVLTPNGWAEAPASTPQIIQEHHIVPIRLAGQDTHILKPTHKYRINGGQYQILYNPDGSELTDIGKFSSGDIVCGDESIMVNAGNFRGSIMAQTGSVSITNLNPITSRNAEMQPGTYIKNTSSADSSNPCWIWDEYFE